MADKSVTAASVIASASAVTKTVTAGETLTAGQPVYKNTSTGRYQAADANDVAKSLVAGIALHGAANGQPLRIVVSDPDFTPGCTLTVGEVLVVSATAGGIAPVADLATGYYPTVLGVAKSTTKMVLNPTAAGAVMA